MVKRKKYTKEFKEEAAKLVTEEGYSQGQASRSLGISAKNLSRWVQGAKGLKSNNKIVSPENAEVARLKKEIHQLKLEREILKKAAAFFAKETN